MAVREFDGTGGDAFIEFSTGALTGLNYGTVACLVKCINNGLGDSAPFVLTDSAENYEGSLYFDDLAWWHSPGGGSGGAVDVSVVGAGWILIVARKDTGTSDVRFSMYFYDTDTWVHDFGTDAGANQPDWSSVGATGKIFVDGADAVFRIAAQAVWQNTLPWADDTSGDDDIEAAGLEISLQSWADVSPDGLWRFIQDANTTPVTDLTGNGADEVSIAGTTVVTDDDPPGFLPWLTGEVVYSQTQPSSSSMSLSGLTDSRTEGMLLVVLSVDRSSGVDAVFSAGDAGLEAAVKLTRQELTLPADTGFRRSIHVFTGVIPSGVGSAILSVNVEDGEGVAVADSTSAAIINVAANELTVADIVAGDTGTATATSLVTGDTAVIPVGDHLLIAAGTSRGETAIDDRWTVTTSTPDDPAGGTHQLSVLNGTGANAQFGSMGIGYFPSASAQVRNDTLNVSPNARELTAFLMVLTASPVREFDGVDDDLVTATGALQVGASEFSYGTVAFIVKRGSTGTNDTVIAFNDSSGDTVFLVSFSSASRLTWVRFFPTDQSQGPTIDNIEDYFLVVARKPTGTNVVRFSVYNFTTGVWTHEDGDGTGVPDNDADAVDIRLTRDETADFFDGRIAVRAAWHNSLGPSDAWTADASGDAAIEAAGLEALFQNWADAEPDALWKFDQGLLRVRGGDNVFIQDGFVYHEFTASDDLIVESTVEVEWLLAAGGGGGGFADNNIVAGGGGGAGGVRGTDAGVGSEATKTLTPDTYPVVVGDGGAGSTTDTSGGVGGDSVFDGTTSDGGGGGAGSDSNGVAGGSGGGAGGSPVGTTSTGGTGTAGQGFDGGDNPSGDQGGAGGGGRSEVGGNSVGTQEGGPGGDGISVWGGQYEIGGGGGGGGVFAAGGSSGPGGLGGGGDGADSDNGIDATPGTDGTGGGGGGGAGEAHLGQDGGSGIAVIRYPIPVLDLTGNGADQSSVTGTTVVTDDPVPGFNFELAEPAVIPDGPFGRYRTSQLALSNTDPVSTFTDEGSGGNDLTQTGSARPTFEAAGFNGLPSVLFDGTDDFMQTAAYSSPIPQTNTIVIMGEAVTVSGVTSEYLCDGITTNERHSIISIGDGDGNLGVFAGNTLVNAERHLSAGEDFCLIVACNGDSSELRYNNGGNELNAVNAGLDELGGFSLGGRFDGFTTTPGANIRVVEVLIYDRALDAGERTQLQNYFEATYLQEEAVTASVSHGLVLGHSATAQTDTVVTVDHGLVLGHSAVIDSEVRVVDVTHGLVLGHSATIDSEAQVAVAHGLVLGHSAAGSIGQGVVVAVNHGLVLGHSASFTIEVEALFNMEVVALEPVLRHATAGAPVFLTRTAGAPVFLVRVALAPVFRGRQAGAPAFAHGGAGPVTLVPRTALAPEFIDRNAGDPVFSHGDAGEPTRGV